MKKQIAFLFFALLSFTWQSNAQCYYTLEMNDSFYDGWNGNTMDVLVNGTVILDDVTLEDGGQGIIQFPVNTGDDITTIWNGGGNWADETSYRILDVFGNEVGSGQESDIESGTIIANCPTCLPGTELAVTSLTSTTAEVSWTANTSESDTFVVDWRESGTSIWNSSESLNADSSSYQITGLTENTYYQWQLTTYCDEDESNISVSGPEFYTGYCISEPTSNDGNGISKIQLGTTEYAVEDVTYADFTTETPVDFAQGEVANVQITFETGYSYFTNIWIDFNDNLIFNEEELVSQGESLNDYPTVLDASFEMPADAPLGNHTMRIGTADSGQATPNPCYNGTFGVTVDFVINVVEGSQAIQTLSQYQFNLYPNPVQNNLNLSANSNIKSISIYNMTGQEVLRSAPAKTQLTIDTQNLNKGSYILKVNINDTFGYYRFIKR